MGSDEASSLLGNWLRAGGGGSLLSLFVKDTPGKKHGWNHCESELEGTLGIYLYVYKNTDMCFIDILGQRMRSSAPPARMASGVSVR